MRRPQTPTLVPILIELVYLWVVIAVRKLRGIPLSRDWGLPKCFEAGYESVAGSCSDRPALKCEPDRLRADQRVAFDLGIAAAMLDAVKPHASQLYMKHLAIGRFQVQLERANAQIMEN